MSHSVARRGCFTEFRWGHVSFVVPSGLLEVCSPCKRFPSDVDHFPGLRRVGDFAKNLRPTRASATPTSGRLRNYRFFQFFEINYPQTFLTHHNATEECPREFNPIFSMLSFGPGTQKKRARKTAGGLPGRYRFFQIPKTVGISPKPGFFD